MKTPYYPPEAETIFLEMEEVITTSGTEYDGPSVATPSAELFDFDWS